MSFSLGEIKVDEIEVLVQNIRKNPKSQSEPLVTGIKFLKPPEPVLDFLRQFIETRVTDRRGDKRSR